METLQQTTLNPDKLNHLDVWAIPMQVRSQGFILNVKFPRLVILLKELPQLLMYLYSVLLRLHLAIACGEIEAIQISFDTMGLAQICSMLHIRAKNLETSQKLR